MLNSEITAYFEEIASRLKRILHSDNEKKFTSNFEDDYQTYWSKIKTPFMVLESGVGRLKVHGDGYVDLKRILISIHVPVGDLKKTKTATAEAFEVAEIIMKQVIARLIEDGEDYSNCPKFLQKFDASSVIYEHSESKVSNFVTCFASFEIEDFNFIELNENEWQ